MVNITTNEQIEFSFREKADGKLQLYNAVWVYLLTLVHARWDTRLMGFMKANKDKRSHQLNESNEHRRKI